MLFNAWRHGKQPSMRRYKAESVGHIVTHSSTTTPVRDTSRLIMILYNHYSKQNSLSRNVPMVFHLIIHKVNTNQNLAPYCSAVVHLQTQIIYSVVIHTQYRGNVMTVRQHHSHKFGNILKTESGQILPHLCSSYMISNKFD